MKGKLTTSDHPYNVPKEEDYKVWNSFYSKTMGDYSQIILQMLSPYEIKLIKNWSDKIIGKIGTSNSIIMEDAPIINTWKPFRFYIEDKIVGGFNMMITDEYINFGILDYSKQKKKGRVFKKFKKELTAVFNIIRSFETIHPIVVLQNENERYKQCLNEISKLTEESIVDYINSLGADPHKWYNINIITHTFQHFGFDKWLIEFPDIMDYYKETGSSIVAEMIMHLVMDISFIKHYGTILNKAIVQNANSYLREIGCMSEFEKKENWIPMFRADRNYKGLNTSIIGDDYYDDIPNCGRCSSISHEKSEWQYNDIHEMHKENFSEVAQVIDYFIVNQELKKWIDENVLTPLLDRINNTSDSSLVIDNFEPLPLWKPLKLNLSDNINEYCLYDFSDDYIEYTLSTNDLKSGLKESLYLGYYRGVYSFYHFIYLINRFINIYDVWNDFENRYAYDNTLLHPFVNGEIHQLLEEIGKNDNMSHNTDIVSNIISHFKLSKIIYEWDRLEKNERYSPHNPKFIESLLLYKQKVRQLKQIPNTWFERSCENKNLHYHCFPYDKKDETKSVNTIMESILSNYCNQVKLCNNVYREFEICRYSMPEIIIGDGLNIL